MSVIVVFLRPLGLRLAYATTRHNLGYGVVDQLAGTKSFAAGAGSYYFCEIESESGPIVLLKPTTYMNRSGLAVAQLAEAQSLAPSQILVIADDFNLPLGRLRLRQGGSDGGHKGMASIIYHLNSDDFPRIRLGIGPVPDELPAEDFVLDKFTSNERAAADEMINRAAQAVMTWINKGFEEAAAQYNRAIDDN